MRENVDRLHAIVSGRVQGVGFRYFTQHVALGMRVTGFVRNRPDRTVEIEAQGEKAEVDRFFDQVRIGPHGSRVDDIRTASISVHPEEDGFEIQH